MPSFSDERLHFGAERELSIFKEIPPHTLGINMSKGTPVMQRLIITSRSEAYLLASVYNSSPILFAPWMTRIWYLCPLSCTYNPEFYRLWR